MSEDKTELKKLQEIKNIMNEELQMDIFKKLSKIDVSKHVKKKQNLTYLSWAWAWDTVKKEYPLANYEIIHYDNKPYLYDENLGYMVATEVTICGQAIPMHLPVMDGANNAMKHVESFYEVKEWVSRQWTGKYIKKKIVAATMFDVNKTIMRCLVKNLAMFGLGLYIYAGEDLPSNDEKPGYDGKAENEKTTKMELIYEFKKLYPTIKTPNQKQIDFRANIDNATVKQLQSAIKGIQEKK